MHCSLLPLFYLLALSPSVVRLVPTVFAGFSSACGASAGLIGV